MSTQVIYTIIQERLPLSLGYQLKDLKLAEVKKSAQELTCKTKANYVATRKMHIESWVKR